MNWVSHYAHRVCNDESLARYERKYHEFFNLVVHFQPKILTEAGCGISSCAKILSKSLPKSHFILVDISKAMLMFSILNLRDTHINGTLREQDIRTWNPLYSDVIYSHGVLEHFDDATIRAIIARQMERAPVLIHCVPTDQYNTPSVGDERLMGPVEWSRICNPTSIIPINGGYELALIWQL